MTNTTVSRTSYQGVAQIVQYNRPFYLGTIAGIAVAIFVSFFLIRDLRALLLCAAGIAAFWACSSLLASHYIYDLSSLYGFDWLRGCLSAAPKRWINIHAGIDEVSGSIRLLFPASEGKIVDIYDPSEMTEPSINRARKLAGASSANTDKQSLSAFDRHFDTAFLLFAAHELRTSQARLRFFRKAARVLRAGGELILVEHLRDWANFLVFGPGFLHFFPARTWRDTANAAGLKLKMHRKITPFVHVFVLQRPL